MKDYQPVQKNNPYWLPHDVYMHTVWFIRGYDRRAEEAADMIGEYPDPPDGQPRGTNTADTTAKEAANRERLLDQNRAIDQAIKLVPDKYRRAVFRSVVYREQYPRINGIPEYHPDTYRRWRGIFIKNVAKNMGFI